MPNLKVQRNAVRDMTIQAAQEELAVLRRKMFDLRMQSTRGDVKDVRQFAATRKQIARILHKLRTEELFSLEEPEFIEAPEDELALPAPASTEEVAQ